MERKLAKKLRVKEGNLWGDDGINMLFDGIPSVFDSSTDGQMQILPSIDLDKQYSANKLQSCKQLKKEKKPKRASDSDIRTSEKVEASSADEVLENSNGALAKYLHPHIRSHGVEGSKEYAQLQIRGLLNKLCEAKVESMTGEVFALLESTGRCVWSQIVCEEVLSSCSRWNGGCKQHAASFCCICCWHGLFGRD
ncbi:hypothetical protein F511_45023 [Dorcoceras hygrometricum]|uniref:Uncharacterized protein n=1 Tax=Dorcoceras hygrometricum TaxID=472368 RepID=A0A2Z7A4C7_9LAMI|nr:hypothetical protein F511_45023 [Dorcoceras hygrometricum]